MIAAALALSWSVALGSVEPDPPGDAEASAVEPGDLVDEDDTSIEDDGGDEPATEPADSSSQAASPEPESPAAPDPGVASGGPATGPAMGPASAPSPDPDAPLVEPGTSLGGYLDTGELMGRPPPDGHRNIVIGSILVPLGALATVSSAVGLYLTVPAHCKERLASAGVTVGGPDDCRGIFTFNAIRTTYGALMLVSGSVILGIGLVQREKHRQWHQQHGMRASLRPDVGFTRGGAMLGLRLRF